MMFCMTSCCRFGNTVTATSQRKGLRGVSHYFGAETCLGSITAKSRLSARDRKLENGDGQPFDLRDRKHIHEIELHDLSQLLSRAIRELPKAQQEVIDLAFFKGMSQRENCEKANALRGGENSPPFSPAKIVQLPDADAEQDLKRGPNKAGVWNRPQSRRRHHSRGHRNPAKPTSRLLLNVALKFAAKSQDIEVEEVLSKLPPRVSIPRGSEVALFEQRQIILLHLVGHTTRLAGCCESGSKINGSWTAS
jgi:hypothetical protein